MSEYMEDKLCRMYCPYYSATGYKVRYKHWCYKYGTYRAWVRKSHVKEGDVCYWMGLYDKSGPPPDDWRPEQEKDGGKRRCRVCGCTDDDCHQCIEKTGEPCYWVEEDLCSACAGKEV